MVSLSKALVLASLVLFCSTVSAQRHQRSAVPLNDVNIDVKAEDNSRHEHAGGEEAERLKRQVDALNAINIGVNAVDNSRHGAGSGSHGDGEHQPSGPVEQPEPEAPAGEDSERLKRQAERLDDINITVDAVDNSHHGAGGHSGGEEAERLKRNVGPLNAINIGVNATDNSKHGGGRKGEHPTPRGPGPVKPSNPTGDSGSEEGSAGSSETEGPAGDDGAGRGGACKGSNNNNNNNNNNNGNSNNNNNNNNNNCKGNNNNNNNNRLKRQAPTRLDDTSVKVDAVDNSHHGAGANEHGDQAESEGENAGRLARHG